MRSQPESEQHDGLIGGDEVVEHDMRGFPVGAALIDLSHDHVEGAGDHQGDGEGQQPLADFGGDIGFAGAAQDNIANDTGRDSRQQEAEGQPTVELTHVRSLPSIGPLSTTPSPGFPLV
jgi:hypothetical protein